MDPNIALANMRRLVNAWNNNSTTDDDNYLGSELVETFEGLDRWLTDGGFLPNEWNQWGKDTSE